MRPKRLIVLCAVLLLAAAGCTPMAWVRQDSGPEELKQDLSQCRQDAWREAQWRSFLYRPFGATTIVDRFGRRLVVPYSPFGDPFGDSLLEESRLTDFCMRSKGYALVPIEPKP
jgi:hypothetical protein